MADLLPQEPDAPLTKPVTSTARRQKWMAILALAKTEELEELLEGRGGAPDFTWLRPPEFGAVMVRGKAGGTGAPFNLGEMTVTRCALRLEEGGPVGHAYIQGRRARHAELAAVFDALLQQERDGSALEETVIAPLAAAHAARKADRSRRANSTKVDFFTMVRGENPK